MSNTRKTREVQISQELQRLAKAGASTRTSLGLGDYVRKYYFIPLNNLIPFKDQAQKSFPEKEIQQLAESVKKHRVRQPLTVLKTDYSQYHEVVSGEIKLRAANIAINPSFVSRYLALTKLPEKLKNYAIEHNINTRTELTKITKLKDNKKPLEEFFKELSLKKGSNAKPNFYFSVLKFFYKDKKLVLQKKDRIKKLLNEVRQNLKWHLASLIEGIE